MRKTETRWSRTVLVAVVVGLIAIGMQAAGAAPFDPPLMELLPRELDTNSPVF